jgi:uncharacterized Zn-finger protein
VESFPLIGIGHQEYRDENDSTESEYDQDFSSSDASDESQANQKTKLKASKKQKPSDPMHKKADDGTKLSSVLDVEKGKQVNPEPEKLQETVSLRRIKSVEKLQGTMSLRMIKTWEKPQQGTMSLRIRKPVEFKDGECKICGKTFNGKLDLKRHIARRHNEKRGFTCKKCDKRFGLVSDRNKHMERG